MKAQGAATVLQGAALSPWLGCKGRSQGRSQISGWVPREASAGPRRCFRRLSSFWKNLVRPNLFILLCPQDGIRCTCGTWEFNISIRVSYLRCVLSAIPARRQKQKVFELREDLRRCLGLRLEDCLTSLESTICQSIVVVGYLMYSHV